MSCQACSANTFRSYVELQCTATLNVTSQFELFLAAGARWNVTHRVGPWCICRLEKYPEFHDNSSNTSDCKTADSKLVDGHHCV